MTSDLTSHHVGGEPPAIGGDMLARVADLRRRHERARQGPDPLATEWQHGRGKLTPHERLRLLFDEESFTEIEPLRRHRTSGFGLEQRRPYTDGVVIGWGTVLGRTVFAYAQDFRIFGGSLGEAHAQKIHKVMDLAYSSGAPLVSLLDGAGARIQEGIAALAGYGGIFTRNTRASGVIPQISAVLGPCAGGASYSCALTDFVFMVRDTAQMFLTGPDVVRAVNGEQLTHDELGGAQVHTTLSGVATAAYDTESECIEDVRYLLSMLPANNREAPPRAIPADRPDRRSDALCHLVPTDPRRAYDVHHVLTEIVDNGEIFEIQADWARNIVCALARLDGHVVGVVANQPTVFAGAIDIPAAQKAAHFVQVCDAFNIPLVTLVDVPGFLPGPAQEHGGIIRHGAKLLYAYCGATVPRVQIILRKAYGGAYIVMDSLSIGADLSFAWPSNEIAVMGAEGAASVIFRRDIATAADPNTTLRQHIQEYRSALGHPYHAAERGLVDDVIDPALTRPTLIRALAMLRTKHADLPSRKHGITPR